jgi:hypothetical protein
MLSFTLISCLFNAGPPVTSSPAERTIAVTGEAEVKVAPDMVQLMLAVETTEKTVSKAKAVNDERVGKTLATVRKWGVAEKDVQTDQISIQPVSDGSYSYSKTKDPDGYVVRRSVVATLRDVSKFESLLTAVLEAGTNRVESISFQTSELRKHRDTARRDALRAAKEKAEAMAKEYGLKAGKARTISEQESWWGGPVAFRGAAMMQNATQNAGGGAEGTDPFAIGQISIRANVNVTFDLD